MSVAEKAKVDFEYMTLLCGMDKDKLISELEGQIFRLPQEEEKYVTADEYLTGNIRKKLHELENAPEDMDVTNNRTALENAMPPRVEAKDISVKLGAHWVDPKYIADFIIEKFRPDYDTKVFQKTFQKYKSWHRHKHMDSYFHAFPVQFPFRGTAVGQLSELL